jgi:phosphoketolase
MSHCTPETPGSIQENGELGYSVSHAFGGAFDNPSLIIVPVIGDGEAETGPLLPSLNSDKFLNPINDGAVLPVLPHAFLRGSDARQATTLCPPSDMHAVIVQTTFTVQTNVVLPRRRSMVLRCVRCESQFF